MMAVERAHSRWACIEDEAGRILENIAATVVGSQSANLVVLDLDSVLDRPFYRHHAYVEEVDNHSHHHPPLAGVALT